ncbi:sorcin-like [Patiria miniata]|uniref:EF-hand domain-containing protein n=1 Tax=Patiria miniata TaxID=46514 RepID=A0A913Z293_PATMI|nr:sorcin-like [Patiria miniata]
MRALGANSIYGDILGVQHAWVLEYDDCYLDHLWNYCPSLLQPAIWRAPGGYHSQVAGQPNVDPLWGYFSQVAGQDGQIDAEELQRALTSSGIAGSYRFFSKAVCELLILSLDRDRSGMMGFTEFKELWDALNQWKATFLNYDRDRSGTVEPHELHAALIDWGYKLSPQALQAIVRRFAVGDGKMALDDFIHFAVRLRMATDQFRSRDTTQTGHATFKYDDFIQIVMSL